MGLIIDTFRRSGPALRLLCLLALLAALFGVFVGGKLFGPLGLRSMAFQLPELGLLSLAMMVALLSGGLDLSIIATANLAALVMASVLTVTPADLSTLASGVWQFGAVGAGFLAALSVGLLNGWLIAYLRVSPILATLGTMTFVKGVAIGLTHGSVISGFPASIVFIGNGSVLGVPMPLILFLATAVPLTVLLDRTPLGLTIAMIGSNQRAVRYSVIDTRAAQMRVYLLSSFLAAMAGFVMMARFDSANAAYGESYLLLTILACVLGGISPSGGFGSVTGLVIALAILQLISTACILLDFSQFITLSLWGGILILLGVLRRASPVVAALILAPRTTRKPAAQAE
jgi:simple sugar transport system permease protein